MDVVLPEVVAALSSWYTVQGAVTSNVSTVLPLLRNVPRLGECPTSVPQNQGDARQHYVQADLSGR